VDEIGKIAEPREAPQRFLFDQSFDVSRKPAKKANPEDEKPPEPTFSRQELEAARQEGRAEGRLAGMEEAASGMEAVISQLVASIGEQLPALSEAQARANDRLLHDGARLTTTIARKILPTYTAQHGVTELEALITHCLRTLISQPKITVHVDEPYVTAITERLDAAVSASAFDGRFLVEADETMGPSDCRISWPAGGLERCEAEIWREIDEATEKFLGDLTADGAEDTPPDMALDSDGSDEIEIAENSAVDHDDDATTASDVPTSAADAAADMPDPLEDR